MEESISAESFFLKHRFFLGMFACLYVYLQLSRIIPLVPSLPRRGQTQRSNAMHEVSRSRESRGGVKITTFFRQAVLSIEV
ncbi:hypothetical protein BIW11_02592 [Tropilaelaps mercedesae]|uniref:Uncharacterized protein n=1 Tax=Tropilaelaps mercedesae TaxID=418985 RepID=A0A1V9Y0B4_9ACAR|nr:hypothetical protein BIW11_02592 [Tropilaelaps mercedesae]